MTVSREQLLARMESRVQCHYRSADPQTADDWFVCDLPRGHEGDHEARLMYWPTRPEDRADGQ